MSALNQSPIEYPRRILVRCVNWLGDAVMCTPALQRIRERFPQTRLTLLTQEKLAELWAHHPSVDEVITLRPNQNPWTTARQLRPHGFDLALLLPNSPRVALEAFAAQIPQRVGYSNAWRDWLLTQSVPRRSGCYKMKKRSRFEIQRLIRGHPSKLTAGFPFRVEPQIHQIHEYLHLAAALGANPEPLPPRLVVTGQEMETASAKFALDNPSFAGRPVIGLIPGAEYGPAKRWPIERFAAAARAIEQRTDCLLLILGGKGDLALANQLELGINKAARASPQLKTINLAGKTSLRDLCCLLKKCDVLLTNDTGPMHVAAALGTTVVAVFGSTSPELTGPGLNSDGMHHLLRSQAPCSPCFRRTCPIDFRCMNGISIDSVVEMVLKTVETQGKVSIRPAYT